MINTTDLKTALIIATRLVKIVDSVLPKHHDFDLEHILFDFEPVFRIISSNSHCMAITEFKKTQCVGSLCAVSNNEVQQFVKLLKLGCDIVPLQIPNQLIFSVNSDILSLPTINDFKYPDHQKIIDNQLTLDNEENIAEFTYKFFDVTLRPFADLLGGTVRFNIKGKSLPFFATLENENVKHTVVIMPVAS